jgi:hypothetical protein
MAKSPILWPRRAGQEIGLILPPARHHAAAFSFLLSVFGMKQSRAWAAQYDPTTCGLPQNLKGRGSSRPVHSYLQSSSVNSKSVRWRGGASTTRVTNGTDAIDGSAFGLAAFCFGADDLAGRVLLIPAIGRSAKALAIALEA